MAAPAGEASHVPLSLLTAIFAPLAGHCLQGRPQSPYTRSGPSRLPMPTPPRRSPVTR